MTSNLQAQQIHDRFTRGEAISAEERAQLDQWYAELDADENAVLGRTPTQQDLSALRERVDATVAQLRSVTQRIQGLTAENEAVRRDVLALQRQLAQKSARQPA